MQLQADLNADGGVTVALPPSLPQPQRVELWWKVGTPEEAEKLMGEIGGVDWEDLGGSEYWREAPLCRDGEQIGTMDLTVKLDGVAARREVADVSGA